MSWDDALFPAIVATFGDIRIPIREISSEVERSSGNARFSDPSDRLVDLTVYGEERLMRSMLQSNHLNCSLSNRQILDPLKRGARQPVKIPYTQFEHRPEPDGRFFSASCAPL